MTHALLDSACWLLNPDLDEYIVPANPSTGAPGAEHGHSRADSFSRAARREARREVYILFALVVCHAPDKTIGGVLSAYNESMCVTVRRHGATKPTTSQLPNALEQQSQCGACAYHHIASKSNVSLTRTTYVAAFNSNNASAVSPGAAGIVRVFLRRHAPFPPVIMELPRNPKWALNVPFAARELAAGGRHAVVPQVHNLWDRRNCSMCFRGDPECAGPPAVLAPLLCAASRSAPCFSCIAAPEGCQFVPAKERRVGRALQGRRPEPDPPARASAGRPQVHAGDPPVRRVLRGRQVQGPRPGEPAELVHGGHRGVGGGGAEGATAGWQGGG